MNVDELVTRIRNHYVDQFRTFVSAEKKKCTKGAAEIKIKLGAESSELFQNLYCADFVSNDGKATVIELVPEFSLSFELISGRYREASFSLESISWFDVLIHHDLAEPPTAHLTGWFEHWFDPTDARHDKQTELANNIHSLIIGPNEISVDFGTAEPQAFWELLQLLETTGAKKLAVSSSRTSTAGTL